MAGRSRTCAASRFRRPLYRAELRPRVSGRGWTRTSSLLFVRQALSAVELLAQLLQPAPGQGIEPRPPRSERGVLAVRRSRNEDLLCLAALLATRRCCLCHSPTLRPWIVHRSRCRRRTSFVEAFWSPALTLAPVNPQAKAAVVQQRQLPRRSARGPFSLRRGLVSF